MVNKRNVIKVLTFLIIPVLASACTQDAPFPADLIIDHTCTDLSQIPDEWIDSVQANIRVHYAHTSHGSQLTTGLQRIEDSDAKYSQVRQTNSLPTEEGALCIFDGQETETYITPDLYWQAETGMNMTRAVLDNNPSINVSMWSWCCQLYSYNEQQTQEYLDSVAVLESEYPGVTFVYMTCNCQATGSEGYNCFLRDEQIRTYCENNEKVLFDFADLDAHWYNGSDWEYSIYDYEGQDVPTEHEQFDGNEAGHTTYESCEQKGRAVWWMLARLAGWEPEPSSVAESSPVSSSATVYSNLNPTGSSVTISYSIPKAGIVELAIYDPSGRMVRTLFEGSRSAGTHSLEWNGQDDEGKTVPNGTYFCRLSGQGCFAVSNILVLR